MLYSRIPHILCLTGNRPDREGRGDPCEVGGSAGRRHEGKGARERRPAWHGRQDRWHLWRRRVHGRGRAFPGRRARPVLAGGSGESSGGFLDFALAVGIATAKKIASAVIEEGQRSSGTRTPRESPRPTGPRSSSSRPGEWVREHAKSKLFFQLDQCCSSQASICVMAVGIRGTTVLTRGPK